MQIYHNPRCSKSRQTLALLNENGIEPEIILYLEQAPTAKQLKEPGLDFLLKQLEIRMLRRSFEVNSIIVGLTSEQRKQAMHECNAIFKQEVFK